MTDLVEDLRLLQSGAQWACGATATTLGEAADELELLRTALHEIALFPHNPHHRDLSFSAAVDEMAKIASEALRMIKR